MFKARKDVKSVFGTYSIDTDAPDIIDDNLNKDSIYDYLVRQDGQNGLQARILHSDRGIAGMSKPTEYLEGKMADLVKIVGTLKDYAKSTFERYLSRNITVKQAREKTKKDLDEKFARLMKDHEEDYPKTLIDKIVTKLVGK